MRMYFLLIMGMFHSYASLPEGIYRNDFMNTCVTCVWLIENQWCSTDFDREDSPSSPSIMESQGMDLGYASFILSLPPHPVTVADEGL